MKIDINSIPDGFPQSFEKYQPNAPVKIYSGPFTLRNGEKCISCDGDLFFEWVPGMHIRYDGQVVGDFDFFHCFDMEIAEGHTKLIVGDHEVGEGFSRNISAEKITGKLFNHECLGDKEILVDKATFYIPNLASFLGEQVNWEKRSWASNRIVLEDDEFNITIEKTFNHQKQLEALRAQGGYVIQYYGEVQKKHGELSFEDTRAVLKCLNYFLSFLNGMRTSALLVSGVKDGNEAWLDCLDHKVTYYKSSPTWYSEDKLIDISTLWKGFRSLWLDTEETEKLRAVLEFYLESNTNLVTIENCIILSQAALEFLHNWLIVEADPLDKKLEKGSAYDKITKLIHDSKISVAVPDTLLYLKKLQNLVFTNEYGNKFSINDGPKAVVEIRNALVHGIKWRRQYLDQIDTNARIDIWLLINWYVELLIMSKLGYQGHYKNRCSAHRAGKKVIEKVPWA